MGMEEEGKGRTIEDYKEQIKRDGQREKLLKTVEALTEKVDQVQKQQELFCDPSSGQCFVRRIDLEIFLKEQNEKIPQILGGHVDLSSLFRTLANGKDEHKQDQAVQARIPAELKARWVKQWCRDGECKAILEKEGFEIEDNEKHKGAFPGSSR